MTTKHQSRITGALALMIAQVLVLGLGYVTHFWIGRELGKEAYGIFGIVLAVQSIVGIVLTLGVPTSVSRFVARHEEQARSILKQTLRLQALIALVISVTTLLLAPAVASVLRDSSLTPYIRFIAVVIFLQSFYTIFVQFLAGMHRFNRQALLTSFYAIVKVAGSISLIYFLHVYGAFAGFAIGGIAAAALGWWWAHNLGGTRPSGLRTQDFLSFASLYVLILIGLQLVMSLDLFMVKAVLASNEQAGLYNASSTLARIPYMLLQALAFILLPSVSALTKPGASHDKAASFISDTLRYLIALIVPAVALAAATSRGLLHLFYSSDFIGAAPSLTILMVGLGALSFFLLIANIVAGAGRAKVGLFLTFGMLLLSAGLGVVLIPRFGLLGAAWQTTIAGLVGLTFLSIYTFKTFHIPLPVKSTINILIASAAAVAVTYLWQASPLTLIPQYLLAGVTYLVVLILLREVKPADRELIARIHPRLKWIAPGE